MLLFGAGLFAGLLLTPLQRDLATRWPWVGATPAGLFATPNLIWQATRDWPLLRHLETLSESQLAHVAPVDFLVEQVLMMHPITLPIWGTGLVVFFFRWGREVRVLGWTYVVCLVLLLVLNGKAYYLAAAYPMLPAGAPSVSAGSCGGGAPARSGP